MKGGFIYIMGNDRPTLYIGVTSNLLKRVFEHKNEVVPGFTSKYKLEKLLYYESFGTIEEAIAREKQLKNWHRDWKLNLIKSINPKLLDLGADDERTDPETSSG